MAKKNHVEASLFIGRFSLSEEDWHHTVRQNGGEVVAPGSSLSQREEDHLSENRNLFF